MNPTSEICIVNFYGTYSNGTDIAKFSYSCYLFTLSSIIFIKVRTSGCSVRGYLWAKRQKLLLYRAVLCATGTQLHDFMLPNWISFLPLVVAVCLATFIWDGQLHYTTTRRALGFYSILSPLSSNHIQAHAIITRSCQSSLPSKFDQGPSCCLTSVIKWELLINSFNFLLNMLFCPHWFLLEDPLSETDTYTQQHQEIPSSLSHPSNPSTMMPNDA